MRNFKKLYEKTMSEFLLSEDELKRSSETHIEFEEDGTVKSEDLSNFIFANTNGGTEKFTVWTIRTNDSKTDPTKKAGDVMKINGTLTIPKSALSGGKSPTGDAKQTYQNYDLLRMYVSSVDGVSYNHLPPNKKIRSFKTRPIFKLRIGKKEYDII